LVEDCIAALKQRQGNVGCVTVLDERTPIPQFGNRICRMRLRGFLLNGSLQRTARMGIHRQHI
jgi:hypothetical protein